MKKHAEDKIGRDDIVSQLLSKIDNLPSNENKCVGLNGEWGSGKSWIMTELYEKIKDKNDYIVITYDAWKNNFYSDPLIAMLYCIHDTLEKYAQNQKGISKVTAYRIKQAVKKTATDTCEKIFSSLFKKTIETLNKTDLGIIIAFAMEFIGEVIRQAKSSILDNKIFDEFKSYQKLLDDTIFVLNKLTETDEGLHTRKLVILVDELDRCMPNEQLLVLERLHHLFEVNNCIVIVAFNKKQVLETLKELYAVPDGNVYLQKFFAESFYLPEQGGYYFKNWIKHNLAQCNASAKNLISDEQLASYATYFINMIKTDDEDSPSNTRKLERYLSNAERVIASISEKNRSYFDISYMLIILHLSEKKMYDPRHYFKKSSDIQAPINLFTINCREARIVTKGSVELSPQNYYTLFNDANINKANYYLNMWYGLVGTLNISVVQAIFPEFVLSSNWNKSLMEDIFNGLKCI